MGRTRLSPFTRNPGDPPTIPGITNRHVLKRDREKDSYRFNITGFRINAGGISMAASISCGRHHTLLINDNNEVSGWGNNDELALGIKAIRGPVQASDGMVVYPSMDPRLKKKIAAGEDHTLILQGGRVASMGSGKDGCLGHTSPCGWVPFPTGVQISLIAAGPKHSLAVSRNKTDLWAWGKSQADSVGITRSSMTPVKFTLRNNSPIIQVSVGEDFSLALCKDGNVYSWGVGANGRLGHGDTSDKLRPQVIRELIFDQLSRVTQISAGSAHSMALTRTGMVYSWGAGANGRLGLGHQNDTRIPTHLREVPFSTWVSCGTRHSLAVTHRTKDGVTLYTWGCAKYGKLGLADVPESQRFLAPQPVVSFLAEKPFYDVLEASCGHQHTVAIAVKASSSKEEKLTKRFRVYAWGSADGFRCGIPSRGREFKTPEIVELRSHSNSNEAPTYLRKRLAKMEKIAKEKKIEAQGKHAIDVAAGHAHSMARCKDNTLYAWGSNTNGQLGIGKFPQTLSPARVTFPSKGRVDAVACGMNHSLAVLSGGNLFSWGSNRNGQLGLGDFKDRFKPVIVEALQGANVKEIACGGEHSGAIAEVGNINDDLNEHEKEHSFQFFLWGCNKRGQLGMGSRATCYGIPRKVDEIRDLGFTDVDLALGMNHTLILCKKDEKDEGKHSTIHRSWLYVCGDNESFQLGIQDCDEGSFQTAPKLVDNKTFVDAPDKGPGSKEGGVNSFYIRMIAAGPDFSIAIAREQASHKDSLFAWGMPHGLGKKQARPRKVKEFENYVNFYCLSELEPGEDNWLHSMKFENISAGADHVIAIVTINASRKHIFVWGDSSFGKLGVGNVIDALKLQNKMKRDTNMGDDQDSSKDDEKENKSQRMGLLPQVVPTSELAKRSHRIYIEQLKGCTRAAAGSSHSIAVNPETGHVFVWGSTNDGRLGIGDMEESTIIVPRANPSFASEDAKVEEKKGVEATADEGADKKVESKSVIAADLESGLKLADDIPDTHSGLTTISTTEEFAASRKQAHDKQRSIIQSHARNKKKFETICGLFDEREGNMQNIRRAITVRLEKQLQGNIFRKQTDAEVHTARMNPFEQTISRLYLDPSLMATIFKVLHREFGHKNATGIGYRFDSTQPDMKRSRNFDIGPLDEKVLDNEAKTKENKESTSSLADEEKQFVELVFAVYDLSRPHARKRFQVFFKMIFEYIIHPTYSAQVTTDVFSKSSLLWHIFKNAFSRGLSRAVIGSAMDKILSDHRLAPIHYSNDNPLGVLFIQKGQPNADAKHPLTGSGDVDIPGGFFEGMIQIKARARRLLTLLTNITDKTCRKYVAELLQGSRINPKKEVRGSDGVEWLLQICYYCIENRAQEMRRDTHIRSKSVDEKMVDKWRGNIIKRVSRATLQAIIHVAIDTAAARFNRNSYIEGVMGRVLGKEKKKKTKKRVAEESQKSGPKLITDFLGHSTGRIGGMSVDIEMMVLHAFLGPKELEGYLLRRSRGPLLVKGARKKDMERWFGWKEERMSNIGPATAQAVSAKFGDLSILEIELDGNNDWLTEEPIDTYDKDVTPKQDKELIKQLETLTPNLDAYMKVVASRRVRHKKHLKELFSSLLTETLAIRSEETIRFVPLSADVQNFLKMYTRHPAWVGGGGGSTLVSRPGVFRMIPFYMDRTRRLKYNSECFLWHPSMPPVIKDSKKLILDLDKISRRPKFGGGGVFKGASTREDRAKIRGEIYGKIIEEALDDNLKESLDLLGTAETSRDEAIRIAAAAVKRWVEKSGGRLKLEELSLDFKLGHVTDPKRVFEKVAREWVRYKKRQKRQERGQLEISDEECFLIYSALKDPSFQELFARRAGEGAWKEMLSMLRRKRDTAQTGAEKYERAINVLQTIKAINPLENSEIVLAKTRTVKTDLLDAAQLYIALEEIEVERLMNLQILHLAQKIYDEEVIEGVQTTYFATIGKETRELENMFKDITGPVMRKEIQERRRRIGGKDIMKHRSENVLDNENLSCSPIYDQNPITVVGERGTMREFSYMWLRDQGILLRPEFDHTNACFSLVCPLPMLQLCFTGNNEKDVLFLKKLSFLFVSTQKQDVFWMHLLYKGETLLLQSNVSITDLRQHVAEQVRISAVKKRRNAEDGGGNPSGVIPPITKQPTGVKSSLSMIDKEGEAKYALPAALFKAENQAEGKEGLKGDGGSSRYKTMEDVIYSMQDLTTKGEESIESCITLDARDDHVTHAALSRADKNHLYKGIFYVFFDPLGSPTPRKQRCVFAFHAESLLNHLEALPTAPAGFIHQLDIQDPHHFRMLTHKYDINSGLMKMFVS